MSESLLRRKIMPIAALGVSVLTLAGCRACGFADDQPFSFSCPPETPKAKVAPPQYTDVPDSFKNKLEIVLSCVNETTGAQSAPSRIDTGSAGFDDAQPGERQYTIDIGYSVDSTQPPATIASITSGDAAHPMAGVIVMKGMYRFDAMAGPDPISVSK